MIIGTEVGVAKAEVARSFSSFWMTGIEGADDIDVHGHPLELAAVTGQAAPFDADYQRVATLGLKTLRESVAWRVCAPHSHRRLDFSRLLLPADAAEAHGAQVLWTAA